MENTNDKPTHEMPDLNNTIKTHILGVISDLCSDFLYYDRKEDDTLSVEQLNNAVKDGMVTIDEMVEEFKKHLTNTFND